MVKMIEYKYEDTAGKLGLLGNRTSKVVTEGGSSTTNYSYNTANEITSDGNNTYTHDDNGNLTSDGQYTYIYDAENQLIQVKEGTTVIAEYEYNADGLRTKKVADGKTELYYYNGGKLAYIADGNNNMKYFFTRDASGRLLNMMDYTGASTETYWYLYDAHGNVVGMADKNGQKVVTYKYDAWGNITEATGTATTGDGELLKDANPFKYSGYQYDNETGFYYLKSRYYNPDLGRFLTRDVIPSVNLYMYCENNPVNLIDPDGFVGFRDKARNFARRVTYEWTKIALSGFIGLVAFANIYDYTPLGNSNGILGNVAKRTNFVYISKNAKGVVQYIGITNNLARRAAEHLRTKGIRIEPLMKGLSRSDAKAVEQALIEIHGLQKNGGSLMNKINSISKSNPNYAKQLKRGYEFLKSVGYK